MLSRGPRRNRGVVPVSPVRVDIPAKRLVSKSSRPLSPFVCHSFYSGRVRQGRPAFTASTCRSEVRSFLLRATCSYVNAVRS